MPIARTLKTAGTKRGNALLCYIRDAGFAPEDSPHLLFHTNYWECREIIRQLLELGFDVDCVDFDDSRFAPPRSKRYDLVMDASNYLGRFPALQEAPLKIAYMTESYDAFNNRASRRRVEALEQRRGGFCRPEREAPSRLGTYRAADTCTLLGNAWTLSTFPEEVRRKTHLLHVTYSLLVEHATEPDTCSYGRGFLFFSGYGAVHKGLDLVLEVFSRHPEWNLHIVGPHLRQKEFVALYEKELLHLPHIRAHGWLSPSSPEFQAIRRQCFAFVMPSCAEGMASAVITTMAMGLHPIVSKTCGVTLPEWVLTGGGGPYLQTCSLEEIEQACAAALARPAEALREESARLRRHTQTHYGRQAYSQALARLLTDAIEHSFLSSTQPTINH